MIKVTHISTVKDFFNVYNVTVIINSKGEYVYTLRSQYDVDEFERLLKHHPGKALNWLKKVSSEYLKINS